MTLCYCQNSIIQCNIAFRDSKLKKFPCTPCTCSARLGTPNFNFSFPNQKDLPTAPSQAAVVVLGETRTAHIDCMLYKRTMHYPSRMTLKLYFVRNRKTNIPHE